MNNILSQEYYVVRNNLATFNQAIDIDMSKGYTHIAITSCSIPKTYYVLNSDTELKVYENGSIRTITVFKGNYTVSNFASLLPTYLSGSTAWTYAVSYPDAGSVDESKYTYTVSGNGGIQPRFYTDDKYLAQVMGLVLSQWNDFDSDKLVSPYALNFQAYDELLIKSNIVENKLSLLQEIYSSGNPYNSSILWVNPSIELNAKRLNSAKTNSYNFSLQDIDGNEVDLNGSEWSMVITVFKVDNLSYLLKKMIHTMALQHSLSQVDS
jgi:hypothetical protein